MIFARWFAFKSCLKICRELVTVVFSIYLKKNYREQHFFYEKCILKLSKKFFSRSSMLCLEDRGKLEPLFEIITSMGLLRYRIADESTFSVIEQELVHIFGSLIKQLDHTIKKTGELGQISGGIAQLEDVYVSALQVVAKNPLYFLFFIEELKDLNERLANFSINLSWQVPRYLQSTITQKCFVMNYYTRKIARQFKPDVEFRRDVIVLLQALHDYFFSILAYLFDRSKHDQAMTEKFQLEKKWVCFPDWVYRRGFSAALQQGHRHFLVRLEQLRQSLFALHYLARQNDNADILSSLESSLMNYAKKIADMILAIIMVLKLQPLSEGLEDLSVSFNELELTFKNTIPHTLEALELQPGNIPPAHLVLELKEFGKLWAVLANTLR